METTGKQTNNVLYVDLKSLGCFISTEIKTHPLFLMHEQ